MLMKRYLILTIGLVFVCLSATAQLTEQQQIQKLNYVYQQIRNNYVDDVPLEPLVEEAIAATIKELDPHSKYLSRDEMSALQTQLRGEFAGIGIKYIVHNDTAVVRTTIDNSPARKANILANDRITHIDNRPVVGLSQDSILVLLRGDIDTKVDLGIVRRGEDKPLNITLRRDNIESSAIGAAFRVGDVGYIAVSTFSKLAVASEFYAAYKALGAIESLVVDLRDNGGGAITSAIDLTGLFLQKGDAIVSTEGRNGSVVYSAQKRNKIYIDTPLVVLINENSASASEIFAGAVQDHDRGLVVGHTSYGKGLVQRVVDLKDGSGLCLTIARYKTPSGRVIQRPYTMGKGDEYLRDTMRYMHPDSIHHDDKLLFRTLKLGRKVYGGGGITPDCYIDTDSLKLSPDVVNAYVEAEFEHAAIDIFDGVSCDSITERYPTYEAFNADYKIGEEIYDIFYDRTAIDRQAIGELDRRFIEAMLMATLAEQIYGDNARHYIYGIRFDYMMQRALEIAAEGVVLI